MHFQVSGVEAFVLFPPLVTFTISFVTSMGGVSGAFLLLPFQVSVLGFDSPAVSPTNLVFNLVAIPSGVYRYIREGRMAWPLAGVVIAGTLPGVLMGVYVRIRFLPDPTLFKLFVGVVLLYIGTQLLYQPLLRYLHGKTEIKEREIEFNKRFSSLRSQFSEPDSGGRSRSAVVKSIKFSLKKYEYEFWGERYSFNPVVLFLFSLFVGLIGGAYGIGGGSILVPFCIAVLGLPVYTVAGAALLSTFATSIVGISYYYLAAIAYESPELAIRPDWMLGLLFGLGGLFGMYCGARFQKFVPERVIKIVLGILILTIAFRYIYQFFG
ncbi:sulfite exporter TauE/SafE family protein [candidate division KSB1 bacterium]